MVGRIGIGWRLVVWVVVGGLGCVCRVCWNGDGLASTTGTKEDDLGQVVVHATQFLMVPDVSQPIT